MTPVNITRFFAQGKNVVQCRLIDSKGSGFSSDPIYIVVFSAPVIRDLHDIRGLVNQNLDDVYKLEDFLYDRDTPIADVTWAISVNPRGPAILQGPHQSISVRSANIPIDSTFVVQASDGIFSVSEEVRVKFSTFMFDAFQVEDAPLVDDYAYVSPYNLGAMLNPPGVNVADVPFGTAFTALQGLSAARVAHGYTFLFPEFPGGNVLSPLTVSIVGQRLNNPNDYDGVILKTSSVYPPLDGQADRNYNFSAESLAQTDWQIRATENIPPGEITLGVIPLDPVPAITDGYGAIFSVNPGESITLFSGSIALPPGPSTISMWFAAEKVSGNENELPTVTLALAEDSYNLSYTRIRAPEVLGRSEYQYLSTSYDVLGTQVNALIQIYGSQTSGRAEVYVDNVRVYPMPRDIDRSLGNTRLPIRFDGAFSSVRSRLGELVMEDPGATVGGRAFVSSGLNRSLTPDIPGDLRQSLYLELNQPTSSVRVQVGPNAVDQNLYPRFLSARSYVQVAKEGGGDFAIGLTNGIQEAVTYISNDHLNEAHDWVRVTAAGLFSQPGLFDPVIILENRNIPGAFPGVFRDGATLAVDDVSLEAFQDSPNLWDHKQLPRLRR